MCDPDTLGSFGNFRLTDHMESGTRDVESARAQLRSRLPIHDLTPNLELGTLNRAEGDGFVWCAAHKANRAAGESPVRNETNVPVVMTDRPLERSGAGKLGCKSPVRSGASEMAGRSIK